MEIHGRLGNTIIMITHDVDEAVLLSDRIVMMTNGPAATVGDILDVRLSRPRRRLELVDDATYNHARASVLEFLYGPPSGAGARGVGRFLWRAKSSSSSATAWRRCASWSGSARSRPTATT